MNRKFSWLLIVFCVSLFGCMDDDVYDAYKQWQKDVATIDNYLTQNNITAIKDVRGVRMVIQQLGTGLPATTQNTVDVDYVGKLFSNGQTFDDGNIEGVVSGFIDGWQIALTTLPAGSIAKVYIPSPYAYANGGTQTIPPNSILVFDMTFNEVVMTSAEENRFKTDTTAIETYLSGKSIEAVTDTTGIRYVINTPGDGAAPEWYDKMKVTYSIKLLTDDTKVVATVNSEPSQNFDSRTIDFIPGMVAALQKIGEGGKITAYIPSFLAFGPSTASHNGATVVPANANLIIEIEVTDIL